jgi:hypothetical protein
MPLPLRPAPLILLVALLGAGTVAVASPQQQHRRGDRPAVAQGSQARGDQDDGGARRPPQQRPEWAEQRPRRNEDGLSDSVRRVEQRTRGQVLSAEPVPYDGRNLNRIKVVDERGRVRVYMDDPQQGQGSQQQAQDPAPTRDNDD